MSDTGGATAIEYALIASLVSVFILTAVTNVGTATVNLFMKVVGKLG